MKKFLASLGLAVVMLLEAIPAHANTYNACPQNDCHVVLGDNDHLMVTGVWMQAKNAPLLSGDGIHINNTLWLSLPVGTQGLLVEMGQSGYCTNWPYCTQNVYEYYVAVGGQLVWIQYASADNSQHTFAIMDAGNNVWNFYLDGQSPAVYSVNGGADQTYGDTAEVGGEVQTPHNGLDSTMTGGTFSDYVQLHKTGASGWQAWSQIWYHTDDGCGQPGIGTTNCLNSQIPQPSVWNWNKVA